MTKKTKLTMTLVAVSSASLILLTGCANKTQTGAAVGAGTGALVGAAVDGTGGALVGAAVGGLAGGAIGRNEDNKDARRGY